uniref:Uncharacterized protein n=1 Tax=Anguilla anguilla TaxID=7936 RepID=A0A0E9PK01_ANGAN
MATQKSNITVISCSLNYGANFSGCASKIH